MCFYIKTGVYFLTLFFMLVVAVISITTMSIDFINYTMIFHFLTKIITWGCFYVTSLFVMRALNNDICFRGEIDYKTQGDGGSVFET